MLMSQAEKRYLARVFAATAIYVVTLFAVSWTFDHHPPAGALRYLLALAPAVPMIGSIGILALYLAEEKDEFIRGVLVKAMLWAIGVVLVFNTVMDTLQRFADVGRPPLFSEFTLFIVVFALAQSAIRWRYR